MKMSVMAPMLCLLVACQRPSLNQLEHPPKPLLWNVQENLPVTGPAHFTEATLDGVFEPDLMRWTQRPDKGSVHIELPVESRPSMVRLAVQGPVKGFTIAAKGQPVPGDFSRLVSQTIRDCQTDKEKALAIFDFVVDEFHDWWFPAEGFEKVRRYPRNVSDQIWGYGYGMCSDSSQIAAAMWREAGMSSKIVKIHPYHTVASVKYDGKWHLFDPQHRRYWVDDEGLIADEHELKAQPELFQRGLNGEGLDPIGYPAEALANWYRDGEFRYHRSKRWETDRSFALDLRPGEVFEIHYVGKPYIYHPDLWLQYYGEDTLRRDPPWPFKGLLRYAPHLHGAEPSFETIPTQQGTEAYSVWMSSPYTFTEAWLEVPDLSQDTDVYVWVDYRLVYVGVLIEHRARIGPAIAGSNEFAICLIPREKVAVARDALRQLDVRAYTQIGPFGVPELHADHNEWQLDWAEGQPELALWFRQNGPDLAIAYLGSDPAEPRVGDTTWLRYRVTNSGSGRSQAVEISLFNNTTALLAESTELIGRQTIPPLEPGGSYELTCPWEANTRQTWYHQDPYLQIIDVWADMDKRSSDIDRGNQRLLHYIRLSGNANEN